MKKSIFIILVTLLVSCQQGETSVTEQKQSTITTEGFSWLVGNWQRTNEEADRETFEIWNMKNNSEYVGLGFTLQNNDTIWQEDIRLVKSETGWNFEVTGKGETKPTIFKLKNIETESFACENQANEFPKKISYFKDGNKMKAIISGGTMEIPFEFEKVVQQ